MGNSYSEDPKIIKVDRYQNGIQIYGHFNTVKKVIQLPNSSLVSISVDNRMKIWRTSGSLICDIDAKYVIDDVFHFKGSNDENMIIVKKDNAIGICDRKGKCLVKKSLGYDFIFHYIKLDNINYVIVTEFYISLFNINRFEVTKKLTGSFERAFPLKSKKLLVQGTDYHLYIINTDFNIEKSQQFNDSMINSLCEIKNDRIIFSNQNGCIYSINYNLEELEILYNTPEGKSITNLLELSDGRILFTIDNYMIVSDVDFQGLTRLKYPSKVESVIELKNFNICLASGNRIYICDYIRNKNKKLQKNMISKQIMFDIIFLFD